MSNVQPKNVNYSTAVFKEARAFFLFSLAHYEEVL